MNGLGGLLTKLGRYEEADALLQDALGVRLRVLGKDHPDVGESHSP